MRALRRAVLVALVAAAPLAGCGGRDSEPRALAPTAAHEGPAHVHGVGLDPSDGSLYVATHTGLWRAAPGQSRLGRVGRSRRDLMGFTVAGPGRFLASGHPDATEDEPPLLGLIASADGGESWRAVSLSGEADLHVLRAAGERIYGFDAASGALLVSSDGGRSWRRRPPPGELIDLAVDPGDPDVVVGSGEAGLATSRDAGRSWRTLAADRLGLLAWLEPGRLLMLGGSGTVAVSRDEGRSWKDIGRVDGHPAAIAAGDDVVVAALHDGTVLESGDGGATWAVRAAP